MTRTLFFPPPQRSSQKKIKSNWPRSRRKWGQRWSSFWFPLSRPCHIPGFDGGRVLVYILRISRRSEQMLHTTKTKTIWFNVMCIIDCLSLTVPSPVMSRPPPPIHSSTSECGLNDWIIIHLQNAFDPVRTCAWRWSPRTHVGARYEQHLNVCA